MVESDRPLLLTTKHLTIFLAVCLLLMSAIVTIGSLEAQRSPSDLWPVYLYIVCGPLALTAKTLMVLRESEATEYPRTPVTRYLSKLALLLPVVAGLIPVGLIMQFVR